MSDQPKEPCQHEWVLNMIHMPLEGYDKPGATTCKKCGAFQHSQQVSLTTTLDADPSRREQALREEKENELFRRAVNAESLVKKFGPSIRAVIDQLQCGNFQTPECYQQLDVADIVAYDVWVELKSAIEGFHRHSKVAALQADVQQLQQEKEGIRRYLADPEKRVGVSTGICESTTYGYGTLDKNGYFEFPVPEALVEMRREQQRVTNANAMAALAENKRSNDLTALLKSAEAEKAAFPSKLTRFTEYLSQIRQVVFGDGPLTFDELPSAIEANLRSQDAELLALRRKWEQAERENLEVCICAAVVLDSEVVRGNRHTDAMRTALDLKAWREENGRLTRGGELVQGFVTSRGRFVDREEGLRLQLAAGIASMAEGGYRGNILFSEDLY